MAHPRQMNFFKIVFERFPTLMDKVVDIGSMDINGGPHTIAKKMANEYLGIDIGEGPNVDVICSAHKVEYPSNYFSCAMSSQCFEHNPLWRESLVNMIRMTNPGGLIVFSCSGTGFGEHGTTRSDLGFAAPAAIRLNQEHYKNVRIKDLEKSLNLEILFERTYYYHDYKDRCLYFVGLLRGSNNDDLAKFSLLKSELRKIAFSSCFSPIFLLGFSDRFSRLFPKGVFRSRLRGVLWRIFIWLPSRAMSRHFRRKFLSKLKH